MMIIWFGPSIMRIRNGVDGECLLPMTQDMTALAGGPPSDLAVGLEALTTRSPEVLKS